MTPSLLQNISHILVILYVGGKSSGIFGDPEPPARQQRHNPPGGPSSNIFGAPPEQSPSRSHPNKPKVGHAPTFYTLLTEFFCIALYIYFNTFHSEWNGPTPCAV